MRIEKYGAHKDKQGESEISLHLYGEDGSGHWPVPPNKLRNLLA